MPRALREAQFVALRHVITALDRSASTVSNQIRWANVITPFVVAARNYLSKMEKEGLPIGASPEELSRAVRDGLAKWAEAGGPTSGANSGVDAAVLAEVAEGIGQQVSDLPGEFLNLFAGDGSDENPGWFPLYLRHAATQLNRDEEFARSWQAQMTALLLALMEELVDSGEPQLSLGVATVEPPIGFDRFIYLRRWTKFVGRAKEMEELLEFARPSRGSPAVQFALLHGVGGQGKSRLALEVRRKAIERYGMQAGFLSRDIAPRNGWDQWRPAVPTFMVIDYAWGRADEVRRILRGLTLPGRTLTQPIRILLLDREGGLAEAYRRGSDLRAYQAWIHTLISGDAHEVQRIQAAFAFETVLKTVADPWEVMIAVFQARGAEPPDRDLALSVLRSVDPNGSPLFAMLVADALAEGVVPQEGDRYRFLLHMIDRENLLPQDRVLRENVLNLVAVATLTRGLDARELPRLFDELAAERLLAPRFRPQDDDLAPALDAAAELTGRRDGTWLYGMEPDLLGETLILSRCDKSNPNADRRIGTLRELAWRAARPGQDGSLLSGEILYLMARDFPGQIVGSGLLVPPRSTEPAVVRTRAATLAGIVQVFDRHVSLDKALSFYSMLRDEAEVQGAPDAIREWRAIAANSLTLSLLFRDLEHHLALDSLMDKDISSLGRSGIRKFYPDENRIAALEFFNQELRNPAELANAPDGVLEERGLTAAGFMYEIIEDDDLEHQVRFYRSEIADPLGKPNATVRMRRARANVAAILLQKIKFTKGLDAALAFYETELRQPAEKPGAPAEVKEERAIVAAGLDKGSATWLGISLGIARAKARFSFIAAMASERGLDAALTLYDSDLRTPAQQPGATEIVKEGRAAAATCLLDHYSTAGRSGEALDFYEKELRNPALALEASAGCQTWRAIAAFNLLTQLDEEADLNQAIGFYNQELREPALQPDAPAALAEWRAKAAFNLLHDLVEIDELDLALRFCVSELARPASATDEIASVDARLALERAARLFERKADQLEHNGVTDIVELLRAAAKRFSSIACPSPPEL